MKTYIEYLEQRLNDLENTYHNLTDKDKRKEYRKMILKIQFILYNEYKNKNKPNYYYIF